ncbi:MAG: bifunctional phosphoribosyl-AMP cyclohydrolase/phosphoribosyl-ATP diphosphatase HisIE [Capnocytophaga sp.]|nr:bifunctional phosphoribosyl-AMP cyclohydrolase/phosphoribosyl-ATP diphosphatase HisIE [Capnocytophaga sp.]
MLHFNKSADGLIPVIIQDEKTLQVRMLGYMNEEAWNKTLAEGKVTFYSRSKERLWTKGETSNNFLLMKSYSVDCDNDTLLIQVEAQGPTCHTGKESCFGNENTHGFLYELEQTIHQRINSKSEGSYTNKLFQRGINKVAQKVGEEAVEVVIEAKDNNDDLFLNESADLLFHFLILLKAKGFTLLDVEKILRERSKK